MPAGVACAVLSAGLASCGGAPSEPPATERSRSVQDLAAVPSRLFGEAPVNPFRLEITHAPVDPGSAGMMTNLRQQLAENGGLAVMNTSSYTATMYLASPDTPRQRIEFDNCQGKSATPSGLYDGAGHFRSVPVPESARPSTGTDSLLTIWAPDTDQLWEFWVMKRTGDGRWSACWGGRIDRVSASGGIFPHPYGASASGLATVASTISVEEARRQRIEHAMTLAVKRIAVPAKTRYPANRSDGQDRSAAALPMGARLRLDPRVDVAALPLTPLGRAVARAAQRYGFVVTETAGVVAVGVEGGARERADTGQNPWAAILGGTPDYFQLKGFPWDRVHVVTAGRPGERTTA